MYLKLTKCSQRSLSSQIIFPDKIKYLPLYIHSLTKSPVLKLFKKGVSINQIISNIYTLYREPVYLTIKYLYPRIYRIDDITSEEQEIVKRMKFDEEGTVLVY